jgi:hypothetical protein
MEGDPILQFPGWKHVLFEGDSQSVVKELKSSTESWSSFGNLIEDSKTTLLNFDSFMVQHVSRVANSATHCLAKVALSLRLEQVWMEGCPPPIQSIVLAE